MRNHLRDPYPSYYADIVLATGCRLVLLLALVAVMAMLAGCKNGGDLDLTLKGSAAAPPLEVGKVN